MRVKLEISSHLPLGNEQQKIWLLVPEHLKVVGDLAYLIQETAGLQEICPFGVVLTVDGFVLPHTQSVHIVRDNDTIVVSRRTEEEQTPDKKKKRKHVAENESQPSRLDLVVKTPTPKSEKKKAKKTPKEENTPSKALTPLGTVKETPAPKVATPAATTKAPVPAPAPVLTSQTKSETTETEEESEFNGRPTAATSKSPVVTSKSPAVSAPGDTPQTLTRKQKKQIKKAKAAELKAQTALEKSSATEPKPAANATPKGTPINTEKKGNQTPKDKPATPSTKETKPHATPIQKKPVEVPQQNSVEKPDSNKMNVDSGKIDTKPKPSPIPQAKPQAPSAQIQYQAAPWGRQNVPAKHQRFIGGEDDELDNISFFYGPQPRNYSTFSSLSGEPKIGDLLAYKVLELTAAKSPEVSSYKEAIVAQYDTRTKSITLQPKGSWNPRPPTDEELSEYLSFFGNDPSVQSTIAFEDMMEVLLLERQ